MANSFLQGQSRASHNAHWGLADFLPFQALAELSIHSWANARATVTKGDRPLSLRRQALTWSVAQTPQEFRVELHTLLLSLCTELAATSITAYRL